MALLAIPSLYLVEKLFGLAAVPLYLGFVALLVWLWQSPRSRRAALGLDERTADGLAAATLLGLAALFALVHPLAQSGRFGPGSDSGDALDRAARALLRGEFPYRERTFLGNPITPMPGELLLAAPFVLAGDGAWQLCLWLALAFLLLREALGAGRALALSWLVLLASPAVLHHWVTGCDYAASSLAVLVLALALTERPAVPAWQGAGCAALLGVATSSRAIFFLVLPLVAGRLIAVRGLRRGAGLGAIAVAAACAVTLPFYLHDPAGFSPLRSAEKLAPLASILPHAALSIPLAAVLASLVLAQPRLNRAREDLLRNAALLLGLTLLVPAILWAAVGAPRLQYTGYCELGLYWGLAWIAAQPDARRARSTGA